VVATFIAFDMVMTSRHGLVFAFNSKYSALSRVRYLGLKLASLRRRCVSTYKKNVEGNHSFPSTNINKLLKVAV